MGGAGAPGIVGAMGPPTHASCRHCGSAGGAVVLRRGGDEAVELRRCDRCGLVSESGRWYAEHPDVYEYYAERLGRSRDELYDPLTAQRLAALLDRLAACAPGRRLLDVGCGEGQLVSVACERGWDAHGIDLSRSAVAICRSFDVSASCTDLFSDELRPASHDVVTMIELVEHVEDPTAFLRRAAELLVPGGLLHLTTPNFGSLGRRLLGADWRIVSGEHLTYFEPRTLRAVAASVPGLRPVEVATRNLSAAAVRRLMPLLPSGAELPAAAYVPGEQFAREQELRHSVERSRLLRAAKAAVNAGLRASGLGEVIGATFVRA